MKRLIATALAAGCLVSSAPVFAGDDDARLRQMVEFGRARVRSRVRHPVGIQGGRSHCRAVRVRAGALCRASAGFAKTSSRRSCGHGELGRLRHACASRRRPSLRTVSRPRFHPGDAQSGRPTRHRRTGHANLTRTTVLEWAKQFDARHAWVRELRRHRRSMEARLMPEVVYPLIYWPVGIALGSWLFFEIAKRM
jgi:hypothetical protein